MYGLTQRSLSILLGMGEITIHRYESGSIPDEAHNQLLIMMQNPWNMKQILMRRGDCIPVSQRKKVVAKLEKLQKHTSIEAQLGHIGV